MVDVISTQVKIPFQLPSFAVSEDLALIGETPTCTYLPLTLALGEVLLAPTLLTFLSSTLLVIGNISIFSVKCWYDCFCLRKNSLLYKLCSGLIFEFNSSGSSWKLYHGDLLHVE